mmetsp:Transcript_11841/g.22932  ORF Transcript_11841/g.22932 Transcript_11841/m.22932 type:complete len:887 (+) Transcript_11841:135-2795(+)
MSSSRLRISNEVTNVLEEMDLASLGPKLEALGVRTMNDLSLVDDADLVRWGLSTIERRRFFGKVRSLLGETESSATGFLPPSALTAVATKRNPGRATRPDTAASSVGPARLDELLGRGSAEHQVPRLAERVLASTGPIDVTELAGRLQRAAPALAQGYDATEWPQFVEASVRAFKRLKVEDGVLAGDRPIISICNTVLFSASEEVISDTACWLRVVTCLATPALVAVIAAACRASREVADGPAVWGKLLSRWYPKATLLNPDYVAQTDLERRLEAALENDYALAALTRRLQPDVPYDIGDLLRALPQQTTPKALIKFMSKHGDNFKQSKDGRKFCISRQEGDLEACKDWLTVNPFTVPPVPALTAAGSETNNKGEPAPVHMGRPSELGSKPLVEADKSDKQNDEEAPPSVPQVCQQLDPKQAFRLYHTGLLSQRSDQSKRGKLEAWEYYSESNSKCVMAAGDLLDLAESRVRAIRNNDPAVVHELVAQTLEGVTYKVPFGFWNRRVRVVSNALNASQLRVGREQRKKFERKLLEFMEWVKKERGFGFYRCDSCGSRWKSGFSYEEISQQCLSCGAYAKPYRIQDLETRQEREAREQDGGKGGGEKEGVRTRTMDQPQVAFALPQIEHTESNKRRWTGSPGPEPKRWQPGRTVAPPAKGGKAGGRGTGIAQAQWPQQRHSEPVVAAEIPAPELPSRPVAQVNRWSSGSGGFFARKRATEAPSASASGAESSVTQPQANSAETVSHNGPAPHEDSPSTASGSTTVAQYTPGQGGFFARRRAAEPASAESSSQALTGSNEAQPPAEQDVANVSDPPRYRPGSGGFFAQRGAAASSADESAAAAATSGNVDEQSTGDASVPSDKLKALQELGLSVEEAAAMGLLGADDVS